MRYELWVRKRTSKITEGLLLDLSKGKKSQKGSQKYARRPHRKYKNRRRKYKKNKKGKGGGKKQGRNFHTNLKTLDWKGKGRIQGPPEGGKKTRIWEKSFHEGFVNFFPGRKV